MKVVFPSVGSLVLLKQDLETLKAFYKTSLMTSKLAQTYQNANTMVQVGNFNYLPKASSIVLYNANVLTIEDMRKILGIYKDDKELNNTTNKQDSEKSNSEVSEDDSLISDDDLLSNSFFQTLKPLN